MFKFTSIIITHYASNEKRSGFLRKTLTSLKNSTKFPYELIIVDNGGSKEDSEFLLDLTDKGEINIYIRNHNNMHFGFARNQGLSICNGDYIAICDNDIVFNPGWLETCIAILEKYPDKKIYATPIYNVAHWRPKYWSDETLEIDGRLVRQNRRAGSNCWVMRRQDFEKVGRFWVHRVAGTKWTNRAGQLGYWAAVTPDIMVNDFGFRKGYNLNACLPIKEDLHNNYEIYFNEDEFKHSNKDKTYIKQRSFDGEM
jgi:glycosyltransferase involved in cell wall biosynthesis